MSAYDNPLNVMLMTALNKFPFTAKLRNGLEVEIKSKRHAWFFSTLYNLDIILKARRIMEDFARKGGKWVVKIAEGFGANVIKLENLRNLIKNVDKLPKEFHDKLYLMQYHRLQYWISWQARKHGMVVKYVNPSYSSVSCPKCGRKMKEVSHRWFKCSCGYENDRDVIAITNLNGRGSLTLSTVPQMRDVNPNR